MKTTKSLRRILLTALLLIEISLGQNIPIHHAHEVNPKPSWQVLSSSQNPNPAIIGQNVTVTWTINAQAGYHTDGYNNGDTVPSPEIISNWSISSYGSINGSTSFTRSEVFTAKVGVLIASSCRLGAPNYYDPCDNSYHDNGDVGYMTHSCVLGPADPNHKEDDEGGGDGTGGGGDDDDDDPPTNPDQGEIQLMNEIVDAESYTTDPDRGSVPTHSDAYVIVKKTNPDDAVMVGANDVSLDLTHSIVTIDSPAKRDLKGKLKLELETGTDAGVTSDYVIFRQNPDTGAQEQITLPYELDVSEPGHSGGGVHDWHTGSERFTFRRTGDGPLKIKCSVDPTQGSVFKTATLHLIPIDIVAAFGFGGETGKDCTEAYLEGEKTSKSGNVYMVKGKAPGGAKKTYAVLLGENQADLQLGLSTPGCFVVFDGHSNMGMGPSFIPANIKRRSDFMNIGNPQTAINWPFFVQDEYPVLTTIEANEIAGTVTNYDVPNLAIADKLRYPNTDGVGAGGTFTKSGTGMGQKHFNRGADNHCLIVNGGSADLPALAYDSFFYNSCNTGKDYIEVFTKGTFFYTGATCSDGDTSLEYVKAIIDGKRGAEVLQAVNAEENVNHMISR